MTREEMSGNYIPGTTLAERETALILLKRIQESASEYSIRDSTAYRALMEAIAMRQSKTPEPQMLEARIDSTDTNAKLDKIIDFISHCGTSRDGPNSIIEMIDLLTSVRVICQRGGEGTHWGRLDAMIASLGIGSVTPRTFRVLTSDTELSSAKVAEDLHVRGC